MSGTDLIAAVKMIAQRGFALYIGADPKKEKAEYGAMVLRGANTREYKTTFARLIGTLMGPAKVQVIKKGTRTVVTVPRAAAGAPPWTWWAEGNDVIIANSPDEVDLIADTLDGKNPARSNIRCASPPRVRRMASFRHSW